jgi:hypothetical protein
MTLVKFRMLLAANVYECNECDSRNIAISPDAKLSWLLDGTVSLLCVTCGYTWEERIPESPKSPGE